MIMISFCQAKDMMPLNSVEKEGFKHSIKVLDPRKSPVKLIFFSNCIDSYMTNVEEELDVKYFATTYDLWSSHTSEPSLSLRMHYIDKERALQSKCLQTVYFHEDHTVKIVSQELEDSLEMWGLSEDQQM